MCFHATDRLAFFKFYSKVGKGSLTCTTSLVRAVHAIPHVSCNIIRVHCLKAGCMACDTVQGHWFAVACRVGCV